MNQAINSIIPEFLTGIFSSPAWRCLWLNKKKLHTSYFFTELHLLNYQEQFPGYHQLKQFIEKNFQQLGYQMHSA